MLLGAIGSGQTPFRQRLPTVDAAYAKTHTVYLADRVVVMSRRPGTIREVIDVKSVRDRDGWDALTRIEDVMDQASFVHLRTHIWKLLREQQGADAH